MDTINLSPIEPVNLSSSSPSSSSQDSPASTESDAEQQTRRLVEGMLKQRSGKDKDGGKGGGTDAGKEGKGSKVPAKLV